MSNKASNHVHKLIKALSKPEKRYFKVYSSRHTLGEKNNYQVLFDAIDKQKVYDEGAILKKFKGEAFTRNFSIAKNRLYDAILKSLDAYHANSSIDAQLKRLIHSAEILYKKTLYGQSAKVLKSAKRMAVKYEKHTSLLEISMWEKLLIEKDNYTEIKESELDDHLKQDQLILEKISNYVHFWNVKSRLFYILNRRGRARSIDELNSFKKIIDDVLMKSEDEALFYKTKYLYHHVYSAYYFGIGDYAKSYDHLQKNVHHIEEHKDRYAEEPNVYFSVLTNTIYVGSQLKRYDEVFDYLEKLRTLPENLKIKQNEDLDIKLFSSAYSIELTVHMLTGQFEEGLNLVPIIEEGLKLYGKKINNVRKAFMYFNIGALYLSKDEYSESLKWINRLLNDIDIDKSEDLYCFGQILNLFIHLELGNQRLIPYALKSAQRYLKTRNRVYKFEEKIMKFISQALKLEDPNQLKEAYTTLKIDLEQLQNDSFEKTAFEYFDFIAWAEHKSTGRDFREIIQEKAEVLRAS